VFLRRLEPPAAVPGRRRQHARAARADGGDERSSRGGWVSIPGRPRAARSERTAPECPRNSKQCFSSRRSEARARAAVDRAGNKPKRILRSSVFRDRRGGGCAPARCARARALRRLPQASRARFRRLDSRGIEQSAPGEDPDARPSRASLEFMETVSRPRRVISRLLDEHPAAPRAPDASAGRHRVGRRNISTGIRSCSRAARRAQLVRRGRGNVEIFRRPTRLRPATCVRRSSAAGCSSRSAEIRGAAADRLHELKTAREGRVRVLPGRRLLDGPRESRRRSAPALACGRPA